MPVWLEVLLNMAIILRLVLPWMLHLTLPCIELRLACSAARLHILVSRMCNLPPPQNRKKRNLFSSGQVLEEFGQKLRDFGPEKIT